MCEILNRSITECTFPALWKTARVIPVHKGSAKDNMNNYRPISLLCVMSKILEKHVYNNVISYFNRNKLLVDNQSGSSSNHSCQTGLTKLVNIWYNSMNAGEVIGCVTIDMRKAFDLVNIDILLKKLRVYGFSDDSILWFKSYLKSRF